jgi:hypothetical protein
MECVSVLGAVMVSVNGLNGLAPNMFSSIATEMNLEKYNLWLSIAIMVKMEWILGATPFRSKTFGQQAFDQLQFYQQAFGRMEL